MLTPIPTKIEEFEDCLIGENGWLIDNPSERADEIKTFLTTALEQRDKEWRELIELAKKTGNKHHPGCLNNDYPGECDCLTWSENEGYNQALDDIITKSKEI